MSDDYYTGPVCYQDGWHYSVDENEQPGERLHLEDTADGSKSRYRLATESDTRSWHDRKHGQFAHIALEDGGAGLTVTADELDAIQALLAERRG